MNRNKILDNIHERLYIQSLRLVCIRIRLLKSSQKAFTQIHQRVIVFRHLHSQVSGQKQGHLIFRVIHARQ